MSELWFWLWCRWTGHRGASFLRHEYQKPTRPLLIIRECQRCGRVPENEVDGILDIIEDELRYEPTA